MNYTVSVNNFDTLIEVSKNNMPRNTFERLQELVADFEGSFLDFQTYIEEVYKELYKKEFSHILDDWDNIDVFTFGRWIIDDDEEFKNMCLYFQEQGWLHDWY